MRPVVTPLEMRQVDSRAIEEVGLDRLIDRAGYSAMIVAKRMLGGLVGQHVVIIVGQGHNGDDGRRCATYLRARGAQVELIDATTSPAAIERADLVIDAAYGTGFHGSYRAPQVHPAVQLLALDIPSGVDGTTGVACEGAVQADVTVTFGAMKLGLLFADGPAHAGRIVVDPIGLAIDRAEHWLVEEADLIGALAPRSQNAHKWQRGVVLIAGSAGMTGAARLSALGALRAGASMLRVGAPGVAAAEFSVTEAVALNLPSQGVLGALEDELNRAHALVIGPGLGRDPHVIAEVREVIGATRVATVIDADGLFALGEITEGRPPPFVDNDQVVLTPHDGEFRRLFGSAPGEDRIGSAQTLARRTHATVLLKGATTVVAAPSGEVLLVNAGTSALATAGTGDVLSGVIGALLARGLPPLLAAAYGAYLHGCAGARAPQEGLIASDLPVLIARVMASFSAQPERAG